ncbi:MAG TPA: hypothetical protein VMW51_02595, partial [Terriglobia bacterium]|nr:hypothetical protein [Terriglobia bacterium]
MVSQDGFLWSGGLGRDRGEGHVFKHRRDLVAAGGRLGAARTRRAGFVGRSGFERKRHPGALLSLAVAGVQN